MQCTLVHAILQHIHQRVVSNLTTGNISAARAQFSGIRQAAPLCTPLPCFLGSTLVQIPNGMSIGSAVFAQLTADSRYTLQRVTPFPP